MSSVFQLKYFGGVAWRRCLRWPACNHRTIPYYNKPRREKKKRAALKWVAQYLLPALGTLYFALAGTWNLPYGEEVVGTITAVDTFLGVVLGISTAQYNRKQAESGK